jgi:lysozyme family protein
LGGVRCRNVVVAVKYTAALAKYYTGLWNGLEVTPARRREAATYAKKILANKARYQAIEQATGVPWHFVALAHYRESTLNFSKNLCNGQPLTMRTTIVPKGRGPYKNFEESAYDALVRIKGYSAKLDWSLGPYCHRIEGYNGYGYHGKGIPSPYLVGGSNKQKSGKYVRDHVYDPSHWDTQLGVLTLLKALMEQDPSIRFGPVIPKPKPIPPATPPSEPPISPPPPDIEPTDPPAEKPGWLGTIWRKIGAAIGTATGLGGITWLTDWQIAALFFGFLLICGGVALAVFFWIWDAEDVREWFKRNVG